MASFHELKASAHSTPGESATRSISNQGHYFGWEITKRMQQPLAKIKIISQTDVTPNMILRAMTGEFNRSPQQPTTNPSGRRKRVVPEYERLRQEREQRKIKVKLRRNRGNGTI